MQAGQHRKAHSQAVAGGGFRAVDTTANPALAPEKADTYNVGAIVETDGLRMMLDYWRFKLKDQITTPGGVTLSSLVAPGGAAAPVNCASPLRPNIVFDNNNTCTQGVTLGSNISRVQQLVVNGPVVNTSGIDFSIDWTKDNVMGGTLGLGMTASYILEYKVADFVLNGVLVASAFEADGNANYDRSVQTIPKLRGSAYINFSWDIHNIRLTVNHTSGVKDNQPDTFVPIASGCNNTVSNPACQLVTFGNRVESFTTFDFTYQLTLDSGTDISFSVFNIGDQAPSAARLEASYDPYIGNPIGRSFKIGITQNF